MGKAGEKQKRTPKTTDKKQFERFVETARKLGVDEDEDTFDLSFRKIVPPKTPPKSKAKGQSTP
jgi:hypothetical protein